MRRTLFSIIALVIVLCTVTISSRNAVYALMKERSDPERLFKDLEASVIRTSQKTQMIELESEHRETVEEILDDVGYKPVEMDAVENAKYTTDVLIKLDRVVALQEADETLRVIWGDVDKDSLELLIPNEATGRGEVVMAQIGIARADYTDNPMIGMCYVYRLSDGRAVIIDGGWPTEECADNLFATLLTMDVARDDEGKIEIAAWIFTHGHSDHIGAFHSFATKYSEQTDVSYLLYNLPSEAVAPSECDVHSFIALANEHYPDAIHVEPHAGLKYYFDNITVDMLYTPEMLYTSGETLAYYNNTSLVFTVECNGTKVLHLGDAGEAVARAIWESYGEEAFLCDAVQIAHHALTTTATSHDWEYLGYIYDATDAKIALLPLGTRNPNEERNGRYSVLIEASILGFQPSFVTNADDNHGLCVVTQGYYDQFVKNVKDGVSPYATFFGYDGVNTVMNESGAISYLASSETENMATVFFIDEYGMNLILNTELNNWIYNQ